MRIPKVYNLESPRTGKPVANQFVIVADDGMYFQSYNTIIAHIATRWDALPILDRDHWDYSVTTLKYLKQFLGTNYSKATIQQKINDGTYTLADLNPRQKREQVTFK